MLIDNKAVRFYSIKRETIDKWLDVFKSYQITYASLRKITGDKYANEDLMMAIQYLCGDRVQLLDVKFKLIENDNFFDISNSELKEARETGELVHPETGELIKDYEEKVYIYFQPSSIVRSLQK